MSASGTSQIHYQKWYDLLEGEISSASTRFELALKLLPEEYGGLARKHSELSGYSLFIDLSYRALSARDTEAKISAEALEGHQFNGNIIFSNYLGTQCPAFTPEKRVEHLLSIRDLFFKAIFHNSVIAVFNLTSLADSRSYGSDSYLPVIHDKRIVSGCKTLSIKCIKEFKWKAHYRSSHHKVKERTNKGTQHFVYIKVIDWEDGNGVSLRRLHSLVEKAKKIRQKKGPGIIAAHCMAGLGRTGTFIVACEIEKLFQQQILTSENYKRVMSALILTARDQRNPLMVTSEHQIVLLYDYAIALLSGLFSEPEKTLRG